METPATSVVSTATMIAPKRAVMIDSTRAVTHRGDTDPAVLAHPSQSARARRGQRTRTRSESVDRTVHEKAPVTCSTCRTTYLPSAIPLASTSPEGWVCDVCQGTLG